MIEEKLSQKVTVLFPKSTTKKLDEICRRTERPKSVTDRPYGAIP